ncbi:MAG: hypothetical protein PVF27_05915 [Gemmatimonadales bacterium]|jgi:hypothetical protein
MNENLKARIVGRLQELPDELGRQLLDYLDFLESKYHRSKRAPSTVQRITEGLEDRLGAGRIGDVAARGTATLMEAAGRVMSGLAAASRVVAEEIEATVPKERAGEDGGEPGEDGGESGETATADANEEGKEAAPPGA